MTGSIHELHRPRRRRLDRLLWGFRRISRCGPVLSNLTTWHVCFIPPVLLLRLIIRQVRLSPPFLVFLLNLFVNTWTPKLRLPTVDVMAVIVVATSVTRQYPHKASKARYIKIKGRNCADNSSRALRETATDRWENTKKSHRVKNLSGKDKRTTRAEDTQN